MMKQVRIVTLMACAVVGTGCGSLSMPSPTQRGAIHISGDADGMAAFSDLLIGSMTQAQQARGRSAYWKQREQTEVELTTRESRPGFLSSLLSGGVK